MADSILAKLTNTKDGKEVFKNLSEMNSNIKLMYTLQKESAKKQEKWEKDKEKTRRREEQDAKRKQGDAPVLGTLFGNKAKDDPDKKKNPLLELIKGFAGSLSSAVKSILNGPFLQKLLIPAAKMLFTKGGPIFGVITAALAGWKIGEWLNKHVINTTAKPAAQQFSSGVAKITDKINNGGQARVNGGTIKSLDSRALIEEKERQIMSSRISGTPMSEMAEKNLNADIAALREINSLIGERQKLNNQLYLYNKDAKNVKDPKKLEENTKEVKSLNEKMKAQEDKIQVLINSRPGLDSELGIQKKQRGGHINVPGSGSGDKVPMMLPPNSFVMNRNASAMLQSGGLVPTLLEPGEKVFGPGQWGPVEHMMNSMVPRFQEGGVTGDTYGKNSKEGILPTGAKTTPKEVKVAKALDKFPGKAMGGEVQQQKKGIYIEGGREGYDPHFHINRADQANFSRSILDEYVKVNGKPLSSGKTVDGGEYGASRDGGRRKHSGIDYAFGGNTQLSLAGSAEWLANNPVRGIGDKTSFKTPAGVFEVIHGSYKGNQLPGSFAGSSSGGDSNPNANGPSAPQGLMGQLTGMGQVGSALKGLMDVYKGSLGENSWLLDMITGGGGGGGMAPGGGMPPGGGSSKLEPGKWNNILELVKKYEAGANGFEAMYPSTKLSGATRMTIAEVSKKATGAVGAWQNLPQYLNARAKAVGLDPNKDLYNEINQQKIAEYLIGPGQAGVSVDMAKRDPKKAMLQLSKVWAAIPRDDSGKSFYAGDGVNKAHIKPEQMYESFKKLQTGGVVNLSRSGQSSGNFKQAQQEFANQIAQAASSPSIVVVPQGGNSGPVGAPDVSPNQMAPSLPSGPSSAQAIDYLHRFAVGLALA